MGIKTEFNPDLALRAFGTQGRLEAECLPETLTPGHSYPFLKEGQRNYWLEGEIPLLETKGNENLSRPLAAVIILEATHFLKKGVPYTKGFYKVNSIFNDGEIHFDGFRRI